MSTPAAPIDGSCLCGAVRYRAAGPFELMTHCHCSRCRRAHGAAFATWVAAPTAGFEWLGGRELVRDYASGAGLHRYFCECCGSVTPAPSTDAESIFMPAGNLHADCGARPVAHIFAESRAPWTRLTDGVKAYPGAPPGYTAPAFADAAQDPDDPARPAPTGALTGGCLCGAVRYAIRRPPPDADDPPALMVNCHCSRCRRARSAAHATNLFVPPERLEWTAGADRVRVFDLPGAARFGQNFCLDCGSPLPRTSTQMGRVNIPAGSLDGDPGVSPAYHIYVGSKAPWWPITDALPQHPQAAPAPRR